MPSAMATFSRRVPADLQPNRISETLRPGWGRRLPPHRHQPDPGGLRLPRRPARRRSPTPAGLPYRPDPARPARAARAERSPAHYRPLGVDVDPDRLLYRLDQRGVRLPLRLLCDPGQAVLVPVPSYPLLST